MRNLGGRALTIGDAGDGADQALSDEFVPDCQLLAWLDALGLAKYSPCVPAPPCLVSCQPRLSFRLSTCARALHASRVHWVSRGSACSTTTLSWMRPQAFCPGGSGSRGAVLAHEPGSAGHWRAAARRAQEAAACGRAPTPRGSLAVCVRVVNEGAGCATGREAESQRASRLVTPPTVREPVGGSRTAVRTGSSHRGGGGLSIKNWFWGRWTFLTVF